MNLDMDTSFSSEISLKNGREDVNNYTSCFSSNTSELGLHLTEFLDLLSVISLSNLDVPNSSGLLKLDDLNRKALEILEKVILIQNSSFVSEDTFDDFVQNLYTSLKAVSNGILYCVNGTEGSDFVEQQNVFLMDMSQLCGKLIESCHKYVKTNPDLFSQLKDDFAYDVFKTSVDILILSTEKGTILASAARFFLLLLKPFKNKLTSMQTKFLGIRMTQHLRKIITDKEIRSQAIVKKANYFGKLLLKFFTDVLITDDFDSECVECLVEVINLLDEVFKYIAANEEEMESNIVFSFYPQILTIFSQSDNFPTVFLNTTSYLKVTVQIQLKVIILSYFKKVRRKHFPVQIILSLLQDVTQVASDNQNGTFPQTLVDTMLQSLCEIIQVFDDKEFNDLQEMLLQFLVFEWPKNCCMVTIEFLASVFAFITSIAPTEIIDEYLFVFSRHNMPPQIKLFIYPVILKQSELRSVRVTGLMDLDLISKFTRLGIKLGEESLMQDDCDFIKLFWDRLKYNWKSTLAHVLLPICISMVHIIPVLDADTIDLVVSTVHLRFFDQPANSYELMATSIILLGLQRKFWNNTPVWSKVADICIKLVFQCTKQAKTDVHVAVKHFVIRCVCSFLDRVNVESKDMIVKLDNLIKKETHNKLSTLNILDTNLTHQISKNSSTTSKESPTEYFKIFDSFLCKMNEKRFEFSDSDSEKLNSIISQLTDFKV